MGSSMTSVGLTSQYLHAGHNRRTERQSTSAGSHEYLASIFSACHGSTNSSPHFCMVSAKTRNILRSTLQVMRGGDNAVCAEGRADEVIE
jgi:hypothetical protein